PLRPASSAANSSQFGSAALSARVMLSVEGQRGLPSGAGRLDLLNVVGSSPAARARPEAVMPFRAARASIARQIWAWFMGFYYRLRNRTFNLLIGTKSAIWDWVGASPSGSRRQPGQNR